MARVSQSARVWGGVQLSAQAALKAWALRPPGMVSWVMLLPEVRITVTHAEYNDATR